MSKGQLVALGHQTPGGNGECPVMDSRGKAVVRIVWFAGTYGVG